MQKKNKLLIQCVMLAIAVLTVLLCCCQYIKKVCKSDIETYHVVEQNLQNINSKDCFTTDFLCVSDEMVSLQIEADTGIGEEGLVLYDIRNNDGESIISDKLSVEVLERDNEKGIFIDVSDVDLKQGEIYTLIIDLSETDNFNITIGNGKMSIRQFFHKGYKAWYILFLILVFCLAVVWLWFAYKRNFGVKLFLITSLFVGIVVVFVMPPANRDDEYRHFIRSYAGAMKDIEIFKAPLNGTENGLIGTAVGDYELMAEVPYQINELRLMDKESNYNGYGYLQEINTSLCLEKLIATSKAKETGERYRVSQAATGFRSSVYYWPQIIAMKIFSFLGSDNVWLFYISRIGQLLVCILLEALAMMIAPKLKSLIWLVAFIPNIVLLRASCNCDGLLISEMILLLAVVVWMKEGKIDICSVKGGLGIFVYLLLLYNIVVMKLPYAIICIVMLIYLTRDNFAKVLSFIDKYKKYVIPAFCAVLLLLIVWLLSTGGAVIGNIIYRFVPKTHVDYITDNPGYIFKLFVNKWIEMIIQLYHGMKGGNFFPYPILLVGILLFTKKLMPLWKRFIIAIVSGIMVMVIVLVGYTMTPPDFGYIWGITYRYLLPFAGFGALCLPSGNETTEKTAEKLIPLCLFVMMSKTLMSWLIGWNI